MTELLTQQGITATFYHAGLNNDVKDQRQKSWIENEHRVMVATNAFGMGIDKPDVRIVIHMDMPDSPEAYFQEAGRAGRDGQKAFAVLLFGKRDKTTLDKRISDTFPEKDYIRDVYEHINYYFQMAMGDGLGCTFAFDLDEFCRNFKHFPVQADSALKILTRAGYLEYTDEQDNTSRLIFTIRRDELYRLQEYDADTEKLINVILRSYTGLFTDYANISEDTLAVRTGLTRQQVYDTLILLTRRRILHYIPGRKTPYIIYTRERKEKDRIVISPEVYEERKASYAKRIKAMTEYATDEDTCRSRMLLHYFGEKDIADCGQCDVCVKKRKQRAGAPPLPLRERVITLLSETPCRAIEVARKLDADREEVDELIASLLSEEIIQANEGVLSI